MTHNDYTKNILNIRDENITFEENFLELVKIKRITIKVFRGKLTYAPILLLLVLIVDIYMRLILELLLNMFLRKIVMS